MTTNKSPREIPYNYTSADDRAALTLLFAPELASKVEAVAARHGSGRALRLLMRFLGDVLIYKRNPFLMQDLVESSARRRRFFRTAERELAAAAIEIARDPEGREVQDACRHLLDELRREITATPQTRRKIRQALSSIVGKENVHFDPFMLVSHATDATDWRLHLPIAVVMPTHESQVGPLLAAIRKLGASAIPRGAGTGLTGGAVPIAPNCIIINTERLNRILDITERELEREDGSRCVAKTMRLEAGVVTEDAIEHAAKLGLVFATDPTSSWACTIGGNVAENAGGKTGVLWGTMIDNLLAYNIAMPSGELLSVRRMDHRMRKILPDDTVSFEVRDGSGELKKTVRLRGDDIRKRGLWKDITNKALGGLPGVQKEGTDGVITSAEFILYPAYEHTATLCLEFFGPDMDEACQAILEITSALENRGEEALQALEHFDEEYVRAIKYKVKSPRREAPRAVLLIDVVGHSREQIDRGVATIRRILSPRRDIALLEAADEAEAKRFWADRKRLGAVAARTNAFKLNEDVVLPLPALAEFARFVAAVNLEEERACQLRFVERVKEYLAGLRPKESVHWLREKTTAAFGLCEKAEQALGSADDRTLRSQAVARGLLADLLDLLRGYQVSSAEVQTIYDEVRVRLLVLATHMHAGDGNVHVNIPILSNDRAMMQRAEMLVDRVMRKVIALGGVCSGEHGIGITKLRYLDRARIAELKAYRAEADPEGLMNPGKLSDYSVLDRIFTPSFNLLELEARILQHGRLEELANRIAQCVRCGRCKPTCCVFHPEQRQFFHPRNRNLAIGSLVEALLYDAQRERSSGFPLLRCLEEVADHCTICHKCQKPCPVSIDSGDVSVLERELLAARHFKRSPPATKAALAYLGTRSRLLNALFRTIVLSIGGRVQRAFARASRPLRSLGTMGRSYPMQLLASPMPAPDSGTLRNLLPTCADDQVLVLTPTKTPTETVFYFPGCGSERLFSRIGAAAVYVLLQLDLRIIIPPPFICCGFPAYANGGKERHSRQVLRDMILFSQIRDMFSYLRFSSCVVTCGTCREALLAMEANEIFGADVIDVAAAAARQGLVVPTGGDYLYHAPCHDSLEAKARAVMSRVGDFRLWPTPHCCSEAGTLALTRPDIANAMRERKSTALTAALASDPVRGTPPASLVRDKKGRAVVLTNCPSCVQGLGRNAGLGITPRHLAVELAQRIGGDAWLEEMRRLACRAEAVRF